jgi:predicted nucleic acid-binding protein
LDTNIAIQIIRNKSARWVTRLTSHTVGEVVISSISVAEEVSSNPVEIPGERAYPPGA